MIRVLLVDDQELVRVGFRIILQSEPGIEVVGEASDGAEAVQLALETAPTGFDEFIIAAADTVMSRPNAELLAEVFPDVPVRGEVRSNATLLSIDKARRVLGYAPKHSWRDAH